MPSSRLSKVGVVGAWYVGACGVVLAPVGVACGVAWGVST